MRVDGGARRDGGQEREGTHDLQRGGAEAGAAVEPVVVTKLVDLDALLIRRRMRHGLCRHRQRLVGLQVVSQAGVVVLEQLGGQVEVLLQRELGVGLTEEGERSQLFDGERAGSRARNAIRRGEGTESGRPAEELS